MSINKVFSEISKSHRSIEYQTPRDFFAPLNWVFKFKLDPCTTKENNLKLQYFYTEFENGLIQPWQCNTYVNPPFGRNVDKWIAKMQKEYDENRDCYYVMLLPARTDTIWFQDLIWNNCQFDDQFIHFVKGRLKFKNDQYNPKNQPHNIGSMLWILGNLHMEKRQDLNNAIKGITISWKEQNIT
jgi:phage N-6-adenine-methyltransferase